MSGQRTHYVEETPEDAVASRASYGAPDWELQGSVTSYLAIAAGQQAGLSDDVERITGQRPVDLREMYEALLAIESLHASPSRPLA